MNLTEPQLDEWIILLKKHLNRRTLMQPRDVFKLLYQGILGPEHLVDSPSAFADYLQAEYEALAPDLDDPLLEAIHPHQNMLRINLKPFKAAGLDLNLLLDACLQTASRPWGTPQVLRSLWESFASLYRQRPFAAFTGSEITDFTTWLASHDYSPVHHSPTYRQAYLPAYRLVASDLTGPWSGISNAQE
jgi:hypothetical protein